MKLKPLRHIMTCLRAALLLGLAASCSDDIRVPADDPAGHDIETGISIRIPNLSRAADFARSRAQENEVSPDATPNAAAIANEGDINDNDLWLFIYSADEGNTGSKYNKAIQIPAINSLPSIDDDGEKLWAGAIKVEGQEDGDDVIKVPLYPGNYKVYVVANLTEYLGSLTTKDSDGNFMPIAESALTEKVLTFTSDHIGPQILKPGHLPMVCLSTDVDEAKADGTFNVLDNNVTNLHCNLSFLCAKVRYTVLFDNTKDTGFSHAQFGDNYFLDFGTGSNVSRVRSKTHILSTGNPGTAYFEGDDATFPIPLTAGVYPGEGYPSDDQKNTSLASHPSGWTGWKATDRRRAWQGTVYLPENPSTTEADRTTLHLDGNVGEADNSYTIPLLTGASGKSDETLKRGKYYDLTIKATKLQTTDITFTVEDWNTKQLVYDLQGPVFLNVEETNITVTAGTETTLAYDTNREIDYYSPKWHDPTTGEDIDFYDISFSNSQAVVTINSGIPAAELKKIEADPELKSQYMFFHLTAGNIHKKITVVPLQLKSFLMVDPEEITIDVREQIASGKYSGTIENGGAFQITVRTNLPQYTVSAENWTQLVANTGANTSSLLYLADKNGNKVEFGQPRDVVNGRETLYLVYDKLNGGEPFWADDPHSMSLEFTVDDEDVMPDYVDVKTRPSNDNYIIHMKGPSTMTDPHIYIYQCLEIPGWYNLNGDYKFANQPIGYEDGSDRFAALEYSFTGRVSFLGWQETSNATLLNGINSGWGKDQGFYIMNELYISNGTTSSTHYNLEYDFFYDYRYDLKDDGSYRCACDACRSNIKKVWPGIRMEKESDGWWKIDLTGAATPGKTLIMFANTHDGAKPRYPKHSKVGVPLFDYPTREGWIDISTVDDNDNSTQVFAFTSENLQEAYKVPTTGKQKFRVVWFKEYSGTVCEKIRMTSPVSGDNLSPSGWLDDNKPYYEFVMDLDNPKTVKWQLYKQGAVYATGDFSATVSDFQWNASKRAFELKEHSHL